jgi:hypothetical protein
VIDLVAAFQAVVEAFDATGTAYVVVGSTSAES